MLLLSNKSISAFIERDQRASEVSKNETTYYERDNEFNQVLLTYSVVLDLIVSVLDACNKLKFPIAGKFGS